MICYLTFVVSAPQIVTHPVDTSAAIPFGGLFTCSARGYGNMSVDWIRIPSKLKLPNKSLTTLESPSRDVFASTLFIPNVTSSDAGEYYCIVWANNKASRSNVAKLQFSGSYVRMISRFMVMRHKAEKTCKSMCLQA